MSYTSKAFSVPFISDDIMKIPVYSFLLCASCSYAKLALHRWWSWDFNAWFLKLFFNSLQQNSWLRVSKSNKFSILKLQVFRILNIAWYIRIRRFMNYFKKLKTPNKQAYFTCNYTVISFLLTIMHNLYFPLFRNLICYCLLIWLLEMKSELQDYSKFQVEIYSVNSISSNSLI